MKRTIVYIDGFNLYYYKDIPRDLPEKCQLPESFTYGTHDRVITRPAAWAPKQEEVKSEK